MADSLIPVIVTDQAGTMAGRAPVSDTFPLPVKVIPGTNIAPLNANTGGYASNLLVKSSPGTLYGAVGYNSNIAQQFIQFHDSATNPAEGSIPVFSIKVLAATGFSYDGGTLGRSFANGIYICNSSTPNVKTLGGVDVLIDAQYI